MREQDWVWKMRNVWPAVHGQRHSSCQTQWIVLDSCEMWGCDDMHKMSANIPGKWQVFCLSVDL